MKVRASFSLSQETLDFITNSAEKDGRSASNWLDLFVMSNSVPSDGRRALHKKESSKDVLYFETVVWPNYGKKGNKKTSLKRFLALNKTNKAAFLNSYLDYVKATPDKKFRKNLETYINQECWNDEIVNESNRKDFGFKEAF